MLVTAANSLLKCFFLTSAISTTLGTLRGRFASRAFVLVFSPLTLYAQTTATQIDVPQGQKFVVIQANSYFGRWDKGVRCHDQGDCTVGFVHTISGGGISYTNTMLSNGTSSPPPGFTLDYSRPEPNLEHPERSDVYYHYVRKETLVFDVRAATASGPLTLTEVFTWAPLPPQITVRTYELASDWVQVHNVTYDLRANASDRPRDARDAAAECDSNGGCYWNFEAGFGNIQTWEGYNGADIDLGNVTVEFILESPLLAPGRPKYLTGTSTNSGQTSANSSQEDPDFVFEPDRNPGYTTGPDSLHLSASTNWQELPGSLVATSRDYGGRAILRAKVTIQGVTYDANVFQEDADWNMAAFTPPSCAGVGSFVMLPVDIDCNGIADSWEKPFANHFGLGDHFADPSIDTDEGFEGTSTLTSVRGDGFSVHDEYRGFHVLEVGGRKWISTSPTKRDLFYADPDGIVGAELNTIFGEITKLGIDLHKVAPWDANSKNSGMLLREGVNRLNRNGLFPGGGGFALVYRNTVLEAGILGSSAANPDDGFTNAGDPILIDRAKIGTTAEIIAPLGGMSEQVLLAEVLAHETGHKLGRPHTTRGVDNIPYATDVSQVTTTSFMRGPGMKNELVTRFIVYALGSQKRMEEEPLNLVGFTFSALKAVAPGPNPPDSVYRVVCKTTETVINTPTRVAIKDQDGTLMNWMPKLTQTLPQDWNFRESDQERNKLCLLPNGCK